MVAALCQTMRSHSHTGYVALEHLVGGDADVLEDEGAVEEEDVVGVRRERWVQGHPQGRVGGDRKRAGAAASYVELRSREDAPDARLKRIDSDLRDAAYHPHATQQTEAQTGSSAPIS